MSQGPFNFSTNLSQDEEIETIEEEKASAYRLESIMSKNKPVDKVSPDKLGEDVKINKN